MPLIKMQGMLEHACGNSYAMNTFELTNLNYRRTESNDV